MAVCPGKIRLNGLVDVAEDGTWVENPKHPLYFLVRMEQIALPLYPQFGTEPNIYYIPPRWAPRPYLRQMFGPGVDHAIERYSAPSRTTAGRAAALPHHAEDDLPLRDRGRTAGAEAELNGKAWQMYNDTVIGFDAKGAGDSAPERGRTAARTADGAAEFDLEIGD
jgi:nitrate reductase beta subunit